MKSTFGNDFLLRSELAKKLYSDIAEKLPIIDYHNHLNIQDVLSNRKFENITQLCISSDPYKHRAMRILGVEEKYITGDSSDYEKFEKWYQCLPRLAGNSLYDWSVMESKQIFGMEIEPFEKDAEQVWNEANEKLEGMPAKSILDHFNIEYSAPCTSLNDDISAYTELDTFAPSLRGDTIVSADKSFISKLSEITGISIASLYDFEKAVDRRLLEFAAAGCRFADHALDDGFVYAKDDGKNEERFAALLAGETLAETEKTLLSSSILKRLGCLYAKHNLAMQLHIGAKRITSKRLRMIAGPAGGYAAIGNCVHVKSLTELLDDIEQGAYGLPKTILFTLNPADNAVLTIMSGSFSKDGVESIVTQGPAWWWCDHRQGIENMLESMSAYSVLSTFIGMTTDSRSLTSFVRHDYFRRILCNWIASRVMDEALPDNYEILSDIVKKMCYENAKGQLTK